MAAQKAIETGIGGWSLGASHIMDVRLFKLPPWIDVIFTTELGVATPDDGPLVLPRAGLTRGDSLACAYQIDEAFRHARASRPGDD